MTIDTHQDIDSMPTKTKLQVIQDIIDHPQVIKQLPLTTQKYLQQIIQSVAANKDALGLLPKRTQASVRSQLTPRKNKAKKPKAKKKLLTKKERSISCKLGWKTRRATHNLEQKPRMCHLTIHIRQETQDILTTAKAKAGCETWNLTLERIATVLEKSKSIDKSPRSTKSVQATRFIRLDKDLVKRLEALHFGGNSDEILYVAAREYIKLKS